MLLSRSVDDRNATILTFCKFHFPQTHLFAKHIQSRNILLSSTLLGKVDVVEKLVIYLFIGKLNSPVVGTGGKIDRRARWLIE